VKASSILKTSGPNHLRFTILGTFALWALGTAVYAFFYVIDRINLADAEGYERLWRWQVFFFGVARLPMLVGLLVLILVLEHRFLRNGAA
jgi:hypothetical protein